MIDFSRKKEYFSSYTMKKRKVGKFISRVSVVLKGKCYTGLNTHWSTLSSSLMLVVVLVVLTVVVFERRGNLVGVQLDRGWLRWTTGLYREVHQVGGRKPPISAPPGTAALPARAVARSEKLVVVELVAASPCVPLVLGHGVWH